MGVPLYVICCFSLAAFNNFSLSLIFAHLITVSQHVSPWVYPVWNSLRFLDLGCYFLSHVREVFFNFIYLFIYLFMAVLGLRFCARAFL